MHRLSNGTQTTVASAPPAVDGTPGYPTEGDPSTGAVPPEIDSYQAFTIQKEISHVVEESGIPLDKTNNGQLYAALNTLYQAKLGCIPVKQNEGNDTETHAVSLGWNSVQPHGDDGRLQLARGRRCRGRQRGDRSEGHGRLLRCLCRNPPVRRDPRW